jgi:hypothetical protein
VYCKNVTDQPMRPDPAMTPEQLYKALDGRVLSVGRQIWRIHVFSVVDDDKGQRWVQLAMRGEPDYSVMLQLAPTTGVGHAILALVRWLYHPGPPNGQPLVVKGSQNASA